MREARTETERQGTRLERLPPRPPKPAATTKQLHERLLRSLADRRFRRTFGA